MNFLETVSKEYVSNIPITIQEKKIINKITEKKTNVEIASELKLTRRTVERIVSRLLNKTNMSTRTDLIKLR
jgi:DNA-binding NarL/FixJ family response regulator